MFPITDPSRADDIHMRRRRAVFLLGGIALVLLMVASHHHTARSQTGSGADKSDLDLDIHNMAIHSSTLSATQLNSILRQIPVVGKLDWQVNGAALPSGTRDGRALSATGHSLEVSVPCSGSITLVPEPDLKDTVFVTPQDEGNAADYGLAFETGDGLRLISSCKHGRPDLVIQAPAAMSLTIQQTGDTDLRMGAFTGPIRLAQSGSGDMVLDQAGSLDVVKSGTGDLSVGFLKGDLHLVQNGSGDSVINRAEVDSIDAVMSGSGDLNIPAGKIGRLNAIIHGSGDLSSDADIGEASVRSGESSDIALPHVRGRLDRSTATD